MTRRSFSFCSSILGFRDRRWLSVLALILFGIVFTFQATVTGAISCHVSDLLQLACLAGVGYVAVSLRNFIEMEDRARTLPKSLASDLQFYEIFRHYAEAMSKIAGIPDPVFRNTALQQLATIGYSLQNLGEGMLTYENTESWRIIYEQILRSKHVYSYKSVAWVKDELYWQDEPGQKSIRLNQELASQRQISMERIFIAHDELWPSNKHIGTSKIIELLEENARSGIKVLIIRESELCNDQDLLADFGIYGSHAVGYQIMDGRQRTNRFTIQFNFEAVNIAEQRWQRLLAYAKPFEEILGRPP